MYSDISSYTELLLDSSSLPVLEETVINIFMGLVLLLLGKRLIRPCSTILAYITFSNIWIFLIANISSYTTDYKLSNNSIMIASRVVGLLQAASFSYFKEPGLYLVSILSGISSGITIYNLIGYNSTSICLAAEVITGLVSAILTYFLKDKIVVFSTSYLGSQLYIRGLSMLFSFGSSLTLNVCTYNKSDYSFGKAVCCTILTTAAICIQYSIFDHSGSIDEDINRLEDKQILLA